MRFESSLARFALYQSLELLPNLANHSCISIVQEKGTGNIISCLINNIENVTVEQCHQFLVKMEAIVFSDYRLVNKFVDKCKESIEKTKCGRLPGVGEDPARLPHKQGATISCLQSKVTELDTPCRKEILRIRYGSGNDNSFSPYNEH